MRVHRLSVSAFGPFGGTVEVDLDEVGRDGLFLLWGPTGAGKTTLLDAVVFALYGTVPGPRGEEKRLRSDHAGAGTRTEVSCELTLAGERLRVTRRPEQQRPKKRGEGWTTEQAKLVVARLTDAGWEPVSTRIDEGSEHLRTRLGLDVHQFCQVVLLPQGDFARFLRAEPEHRADLLRTLFDVGRFAAAESWLADERAAARDRVAQRKAQLATLLARVAQIADVDVPEDLAPELVGSGPGQRVAAWIDAVRATAAHRLASAEAGADAAATEAGGVDTELVSARALGERHARRDRAARDLDVLTGREAALVPLRGERDAGRRAEALRDVLQASGRATADQRQAASALAAAEAAWAPVSGGSAGSATVARELRHQAAAAAALLPEVDRAATTADRIARLDAGITTLAESCAAAALADTAWPQRLADQERVVTGAQEAAARLTGLRASVAAAEAALAAARSADDLARVVERSKPVLASRREEWNDARERWLDLRSRRLEGMAAELAEGLVEGADCPVCGAVEHPRPATHDGPVVTAADEQAARRAVEAAEDVLATASTELEGRERELAALRAQAGPVPVEDQARAVAGLRATTAEVASAAERLDAEQTVLRQLLAEREESARRSAADREELRARTAERTALADALAGMQERLATAAGTDGDLRARIARLTEAAARCETAVEAAAESARRRATADAARRAAEDRARAAGFPDAAAAQAALLPVGRLDELDRQVEGHDRQLAVLRSRLAEPELVDLPPRPDLAAVEQRCAAATRRREETVAERERARRCAAALDGLAGDVTAAEVQVADLRAWADQVTALADLAHGRGANVLRMRLQSFVLAARLEQVAEAASRRLQDMSGGRYTFLHSDAQARNGARGGLGLDVFDEYTAVRRPTKTLSGGESFMASLALALGLADVVTAETGGVRIDTLFVDEGFGTLDPQALDAVMTVLDELRRGGRTVGVISHLEELRTRIPTRLEVVSGRNGSRLAG
jgi:exonuclease SbcC